MRPQINYERDYRQGMQDFEGGIGNKKRDWWHSVCKASEMLIVKNMQISDTTAGASVLLLSSLVFSRGPPGSPALRIQL